MPDAGRLDLERAEPVAGRDYHVVGAAGVPEIAVGVAFGGVVGVEPLALEVLVRGLGVVPVAERIVGVGASSEADLAALADPDLALVLVEYVHVPPGHRLAHRALANLHERVV